MRVYVVPHQVPRFSGFGAFGETPEEHCSRTYANCPDLLAKCRQKACVDLPLVGKVCSNDPPPWTYAGKLARGLPLNGQCPGGVVAQPPVQQPQPGTVVVTSPGTSAGGAIETSFPRQAAPGLWDQLLANKPLLYGGGAALLLGGIWWARRPSGTRAMNGYHKKRRARRTT